MRQLTAVLILLAPALVLIYDYLALGLGGPDATITAVIRTWAKRWPDLPYVVAALLTALWLHLFLEAIIHRP